MMRRSSIFSMMVIGVIVFALLQLPSGTAIAAGQQTATLHVAYGSLNMGVVRLHLSEALDDRPVAATFSKFDEAVVAALDEALTLVVGQTLRVTLIYTAHTRNPEGQHAGV